MIVHPSDLSGDHDGPDWFRLTARPVVIGGGSGRPKRSGYKRTGRPSGRVPLMIIATHGGTVTEFPSLTLARKALRVGLVKIREAIATGEPCQGYTLRLKKEGKR